MIDFDDAITWARGDDDTFTGAFPDDWTQVRTIFGGLIAGVGLRAIREVVGDARPPVTVDVAFLAPVEPGPASVAVSILRSGRHVTQAEARIVQAGAERARISAVLGASRPSSLRVPAAEAAPSRAVAAALDFNALIARSGAASAFVPRFAGHFDLRWGEGGLPFSGGAVAVTGGYVRHRGRASGVEALVALLDSWPSPTLVLASGPVPASSVRWVTHVVEDMSLGPDDWCWMRSETVHAGGGYTTMIARLHGPDGRLLVWGEQLVAIFDGG